MATLIAFLAVQFLYVLVNVEASSCVSVITIISLKSDLG